MTVSPLWRTRLTAVGAAVLALWLATGVAHQEYFWPILIAGTLALLALRQIFALPADTLLLGVAVFGYIAGNRGFAQVSLAGNFPLLPAEFVLLVAGLILIVHSAFRHEFPVRREFMNLLILVWMGICAVRFLFDVRTYGFVALRDFATVYYAAFFFLAQAAARDDRSRSWILGCVFAGCLAMLTLYPLTNLFPHFFLYTFTVRDIPLVYYKGDLVGTFLFAGCVLWYHHFEDRHRLAAVLGSLALAGMAINTNNRASLVGVLSAGLLLLCGRRWRFVATQAVAAVLAAVTILFAAYLTNRSWRQTPLLDVYERVVSITDPFGRRHYYGEETYFKGDDNRFRTVWWQSVFRQTVARNPWLGLGFGYDLASQFAREYYPGRSEDFDTRSPHNVMLTIFGRVGLAGLAPFVLLAALIAWRLFRAARRRDPSVGLWCAAWVILVSACFGVVLEGPMGAVFFWTVLGLANAPRSLAREAVDETESSPVVSEPLPNVPPSV